MKKNKQKFHSLVATFIVSSMVSNSYAWTMGDTQKAGNMITGIMGQYVQMRGQQNQALMQQAAMAQTQQMMSQMKPQMGPAQFFPECPVLQRISNLPANACSSQSTNPADVGKMMAFQSLAQMASQEYERSSIGSIECIANQQKAFNSQLINYQNSLKALQDQLKKDAQVFRDNNLKRLSDMKSNWDDLHGTGSSIDAQTADFKTQFSPTCQSVLKGKTNDKGLVGLMKATSDDNKVATDFALNRPQIEAEIINEGNKISAAVKSGGITSLTDPSLISENYQALFKSTMDAEVGAYNIKAGKLAADIQSVDPSFNIGAMDGISSGNAESNIINSLANYKNSTMRKCMNGESGFTLNDGLKINRNTINGLITQSGTDGGTAATGYRDSVMKILENEDVNVTLDMKLAQIKALDSTYRNMVFNTNSGGRNGSESASAAFAKLASDCETFFTQPSSTGGMSPQEKGKRAQTAMRDLKNAHDALGDKLAQTLSAKLIHCNGQSKKAGSTCNSLSMTPGDPSFTCLDTASKCSVDIRGCYGEITAKVGQKTAMIKNLGDQYNANARAMVARANTLFTQQKTAVAGLLNTIHQKFPGMNFVIGGGADGKEDPLFVSDPAMTKSEFGIDLVAGGDMSKYLDELPKKIGSLSAIIAEQQKKSDAEIKGYLNGPPAPGLISSLKDQKTKWDDLAERCKSAIDASGKAIAEANQKVQEQDAKNMKFCKKYNAFVQSENPSCGGAQKLISTMGDVINSLPGESTNFASQIESICDQSNNEGTAGTESADKMDLSYDLYCPTPDRSNQDLFNALASSKPSLTLELLQAAADQAFAKTSTTKPTETKEAKKANRDLKIKTANREKAEKTRDDAKSKVDLLTEGERADAAKKLEIEKLDKALKVAQANFEEASKKEEEAQTAVDNLDEAAKPNEKSKVEICQQLDSKSLEEKKSKFNAIIQTAVKASKATTSEQTEKLTKIMGQMSGTPCGSISSSLGQKNSPFPWQLPPEAGLASGAIGK